MGEGATMHALLDMQRSWTFEELQRALPEDADWRRYEIVDGALVVSPSARSLHEVVCARLRDAIRDAVPDGSMAIGSMAIELGRSYRIPDLVVASTDVMLADVALLRPADVALAVEVVSPSSRTTDRITKQAEYGAGGIPGYWRVETEPEVTLTAYALRSGTSTYAELGTWGAGQISEIDRPFSVRIPIDALLARD
jgi:Uma2 family endonuclease